MAAAAFCPQYSRDYYSKLYSGESFLFSYSVASSAVSSGLGLLNLFTRGRGKSRNQTPVKPSANSRPRQQSSLLGSFVTFSEDLRHQQQQASPMEVQLWNLHTRSLQHQGQAYQQEKTQLLAKIDSLEAQVQNLLASRTTLQTNLTASNRTLQADLSAMERGKRDVEERLRCKEKAYTQLNSTATVTLDHLRLCEAEASDLRAAKATAEKELSENTVNFKADMAAHERIIGSLQTELAAAREELRALKRESDPNLGQLRLCEARIRAYERAEGGVEDVTPAPSQQHVWPRKIELAKVTGCGTLGEGGHGAVVQGTYQFRCKSSSLKLRAFKLPSVPDTEDTIFFTKGELAEALEHAEAVFHNELAVLIDLGPHPNIITLKRTVVASGQTVGMALSSLQGDLRTMARAFSEAGMQLPKPLIRAIVIDVLRGLQHMHLQQYQHLDVKDTNILLTSMVKPGEVVPSYFKAVVGDPGLARKQGDDGSFSDVQQGTPAYRSPEQAAGVAYVTSDSWSLGLLFHELFFPRHRSQDGDGSQEPCVPTAEEIGRLPDAYAAIVTGFLQRNPLERLTCGEALDVLESHGVVRETEVDDDCSEDSDADYRPAELSEFEYSDDESDAASEAAAAAAMGANISMDATHSPGPLLDISSFGHRLSNGNTSKHYKPEGTGETPSIGATWHTKKGSVPALVVLGKDPVPPEATSPAAASDQASLIDHLFNSDSTPSDTHHQAAETGGATFAPAQSNGGSSSVSAPAPGMLGGTAPPPAAAAIATERRPLAYRPPVSITRAAHYMPSAAPHAKRAPYRPPCFTAKLSSIPTSQQ
ncbi:hypothetical protein WJX73_007839 [Symbiochloris irregularis]|uniref:non-specific serine/threonine protein kinase n=1 Tax=Symbiochloris irregularis TaxID=706552 RepID=A0AAW1PLK8_9CHLO